MPPICFMTLRAKYLNDRDLVVLKDARGRRDFKCHPISRTHGPYRIIHHWKPEISKISVQFQT